jgi:hypothetical protein
MNDLENYVDTLFLKYRKSKEIDDLKDEVLSNLEAKVADLMASGMTNAQAVQKAEEGMISVDFLIDGNKQIFLEQFRMELIQWSFIYLICVWILTIPLLAVWVNLSANLLAFLAMFCVGIYYLIQNVKLKKNRINLKQTAVVNSLHYTKIRKVIWLLWSLFIVISTLATSALYFGSNIWFSRPIRIDGPYAFAGLLIRYFVPFLTVVIPLIGNKACKLIRKYETGEDDED